MNGFGVARASPERKAAEPFKTLASLRPPGHLPPVARKSLVTGAAGFVGRHLVDALVTRGDEVTGLDITPDPGLEGANYAEVDIRNLRDLEAKLEGHDVVYHNASLVQTRKTGAAMVWAVNRDGTQNVLDACRTTEVPRLVYVSSASCVYEGRDIENGDESLPYSKVSQAPYADSKIAAEKLVREANGQGGLHTIALRPHVVFGPGDTRFLPAILARAKSGKLKLGVGLKKKLSDFTYIDNLIDALLLAEDSLLEKPNVVGGEAYFITNGEPRAFFGFVGEILKQLELPPIRGKVPFALAYFGASVAEAVEAMKGEASTADQGVSRFAVRYMCTHHYFSIAKAARDFGYQPRVSLDEGIARTCAHLTQGA